MNWFRLKTCIKCRGDLAADNGDWLCLQCGTYYYTGLYQLRRHIDDSPKGSNLSISEPPKQKLMGAVATPLSAAIQTSPPRLILASMNAAVPAP